MKSFILLVLFLGGSCLAYGALAHGAMSAPILIKTEHSGFVRTGFQEGVTCEIYSDRAVVTTTLGGVGIQSRELKAIKVNGAQLTDLLKKAYLGQIQEKSGPMDGPTTTLSGNYVTDTGTPVQVMLSENNGGNGKIRKNIAPEAEMLIFAISRICK